MTPSPQTRLRKELGLFDVYAISTGAMFSSGFFLLPGLAAALTGPSVALAYLVAALFILPAMFSAAELATAMPRAGGAYYFLDRALGPVMGTVGGLGTWLALILKSAFALVGMGAYLAIYMDIPIEPLAVGLTLVFMGVNIVGAKETGALQRALVVALLAVLLFFVVQGLAEVFSQGIGEVTRERFTPFMPFGITGFMGTVGFVFVSYAGLTQVASVSEEVKNPDRNIPLGMMLSLGTAAFVYTVGVYIIVAVLAPEALRSDLTPVATAAQAFFDWLPAGLGVFLIVIAAAAAFASTGNAGIMSASRYPLAMARDRLLPARLNQVGRFGTPTFSVILTSFLIVACIVFLDVESIAKLASAFQLLLFALLNLAVVIMRESRIEGYDPGYHSPLYPWMQIAGFVAPLWLISEMGQMTILFTAGLVLLAMVWYFKYAHPRVERSGAIFHTFARWGTLRYEGLDRELRSIVREKGLRVDDSFDQVIARAPVMEIPDPVELTELAAMGAKLLEEQTGVPAAVLEGGFRAEVEAGFLPVARGVALPHIRVEGIPHPFILMARCHGGVHLSVPGQEPLAERLRDVRAVFFLVSPEEEPGMHLRLLGHLAQQVDDPAFLDRWGAARDQAHLKETLLQDDQWIHVDVGQGAGLSPWAGREVRELQLPAGVLVALVRRNGLGFVPHGSTVLQDGDHLTVIGEPRALRQLEARREAPLPL